MKYLVIILFAISISCQKQVLQPFIIRLPIDYNGEIIRPTILDDIDHEPLIYDSAIEYGGNITVYYRIKEAPKKIILDDRRITPAQKRINQ